MVGGLIMSHGDDNGLRVPPRLAAVQVVVMAIKGDEAVARVREVGAALKAAGLRVQIDDRVDTPFGRRAVDWELKGVPVRVEIGPRDLEAGTAMPARRIPGGAPPGPEAPGEARSRWTSTRSPRYCRSSWRTTRRWARIPWAVLGQEGEARLAEQGVSVRCLVAEDGSVPDADDAPGTVAVVALAY
jgi:prolyl-tRNA synthetase